MVLRRPRCSLRAQTQALIDAASRRCSVPSRPAARGEHDRPPALGPGNCFNARHRPSLLVTSRQSPFYSSFRRTAASYAFLPLALPRPRRADPPRSVRLAAGLLSGLCRVDSLFAVALLTVAGYSVNNHRGCVFDGSVNVSATWAPSRSRTRWILMPSPSLSPASPTPRSPPCCPCSPLIFFGGSNPVLVRDRPVAWASAWGKAGPEHRHCSHPAAVISGGPAVPERTPDEAQAPHPVLLVGPGVLGSAPGVSPAWRSNFTWTKPGCGPWVSNPWPSRCQLLAPATLAPHALPR